MLSTERKYPMLGPTPGVPPDIDDLEWIALRSRVLAFGSAEVVTHLDRYMEKVGWFVATAKRRR
jgi:hypothetical protein